METFESASSGWIDVVQHTSSSAARRGVLGSKLTTFAIGGPLEALFEAHTVPELQRLVAALQAAEQRPRVIGAGSNLLITSQGLPGAFIRLASGFRCVDRVSSDTFRIGASASLMTVSRSMCEMGLSGLEFAGGIPASFGGAVRMNAGAHGGQMVDVVERLSFVLPDGRLEELPASAVEWKYRWCGVPADAIVTEVVVRMVPGDRESIVRRRHKCLSERKQRQPLTIPSAGSVFKNPDGAHSAGALIESVGLKGAVCGGARISDLHANWIINPGRTALHTDVLTLIERAQHEVSARHGISLEAEVVTWTA